MVMSAKIVLCVIRQILWNLIFWMTDNVVFDRLMPAEKTNDDEVRTFVSGAQSH